MDFKRFKRGSIRRVRMRNFLTYDECEVFPGPKLNVVIGPNGSGKSTITHAICLACCGSTDDIGRTNELSKFVKHGTPENDVTFVEVDLFETADKWVTIRRVLSAQNNRSVWHVNGTQTKLEIVKNLVHSMSIDVDNLCSFMPQDRVGAFSQYNGKEILQNTLKSIRNVSEKSNLFQDQTDLSKLENDKENFRRDRDALQKKHDDLRRELDSLQGELDRINQKQVALDRKKLLRIKLLFVQCDALKTRQDAKDIELKSLQQALSKMEGDLEPVEKEILKLERARERLLQQTSNSTSSSSSSAAAIVTTANTKQLIDGLATNKSKLLQKDNAAADAKGDLDTLSIKRKNAETKLQRLVDDIAHMDETVKRAEDNQHALDAQINETCAQIQRLSVELKAVDEETQGLRMQLTQRQHEATNRARELERLRDYKQLYRQKLLRGDFAANAAGRALEWLDQHLPRLKAEGRVRGNIHGPIGMLCQVSDPVCYAMLEKLVPDGRLMAFIAENHEDATFIRTQFRDVMNLKLDIFTIQNLDILSKPRPYNNQQMREFERFGVEGYLADCVQCNDVVRAFLYSFQSLQTVLWGRERENSRVGMREFSQLCPPPINSFRLYMHNPRDRQTEPRQNYPGSIVEFQGRRSRFNPHGAPSTSSVVVYAGKGYLSSENSQDEDVVHNREALSTELDKLKSGISELQIVIDQKMALKNDLNTQLAVQKQLRQDCVRKKNEPANLYKKLTDLNREKTVVEKLLANDIDNEKRERKEAYVRSMDALFVQMECVLDIADKGFVQICQKSASSLKRRALEQRLDAFEDQKAVIKAKISEQKTLCGQCKKDLHDCAAQFKTKEQELEEIQQQEGEHRFLNELFPLSQSVCETNVADEIETLLIEITAEIEAIHDNPGLRQRQQDLQITLADCSQRLEHSAAAHENAEQSLRDRKDQWINAVKTLTAKLDAVFQNYMAELGFEGAVYLREQGTFLEYELALMVKFRKEAQMTQLSAQKHSGGERTVSTIMYLMALQDLTQSPFRVVDEINQGMDERNERLVLDRIVRNCCGEPGSIGQETAAATASSTSASSLSTYTALTKPQYFLITPKLLPALISLCHPDVTVLCVRSGSGLRNTSWTFEHLVDTYLKQLDDGNMDADDEDEDDWRRSSHAIQKTSNSSKTGPSSILPLKPSTAPNGSGNSYKRKLQDTMKDSTDRDDDEDGEDITVDENVKENGRKKSRSVTVKPEPMQKTKQLVAAKAIQKEVKKEVDLQYEIDLRNALNASRRTHQLPQRGPTELIDLTMD